MDFRFGFHASHGAFALLYPGVEALEKWSVLGVHPDRRVDTRCFDSRAKRGACIHGHRVVRVHHWTDAVVLPDLVVLGEVLVEMHLQVRISLEAQPAIAALELDALIELRYSDDVQPKTEWIVSANKKVYLLF